MLFSKGVVKPDIVFFGEALPARFFSCVQADFKKCDLLIIMGSSLLVQVNTKLYNLHCAFRVLKSVGTYYIVHHNGQQSLSLSSGEYKVLQSTLCI